MTPVLVATGLSRRYGAVQALRDAHMEIRTGEVHALLGSNGAGKSTLVKILTGAVVPDTGEVVVDGHTLAPGNPRSALDAGIACVYQEPNLVPALSVLDNVLLGRQPTTRLGLLDRRQQRQVVEALLAKHSLRLDVDLPVQALPTVQQKEVEIAKALSSSAKVVLMDEPTAWLSRVEVDKLFTSIRNLTRSGVGVLYISHILDEIFEIADRVTIMRDGEVLTTSRVDETDKPSLIRAMLGRELSAQLGQRRPAPAPAAEDVVLECHGLGRAGVFSGIDMRLHRGEIVCLTGLVGAKRSELVRCLFGSERADSGEIRLRGRRVALRRPRDAVRRGIGLVPEDRRRDGLLMSLPVKANLVAAHLGLVSRVGVMWPRRVRRLAERLIRDLGVVPGRTDTAVRDLSGGNQQKVLIGRWIAGRTDVLILDEPTVGVDVGAKADIYERLRELAAQGAAILVVSSDMEEVLAIADRVIVMAQGRITAELSRTEATQDAILHAAGGGPS